MLELRTDSFTILDFKKAITEGIREIDLALSALQSLKDVNKVQLEIIEEAEKNEFIFI